MTRKIIKLIISSPSCKAILPWSHTAAKGFITTLEPKDIIRNRVRVIYPAVLAPKHPDRNHHSRECRVLFVANRPEWNFFLKGGREVIEAYRILKSRRKNVSLTIVGPVPSNITSEYFRLPGTCLTGAVTRAELYQLYNESDIYVMPSFSDTFGMVFLEAMAFSVPIVALNRPYTEEIVKDGETGLLVNLSESSVRWFDQDGRLTMNSDSLIRRILSSDIDVGVVNGLVEKIGWLMDDPGLRRRLGTNGHDEVVSGRFSVVRRNQALREVYLEAAESGIHGYPR